MSLKNIFRGLAFLFLAAGVQAASPTIAPLADVTTYVDHPILVELPVHDAETPTNLLTFRLATSNTSLVDTNKNVLFRWFTDGGVGYIPRWYMTLAPTFGVTGTATNTITVSDGTNTASSTFVLTVIPPPTNALRVANTNVINLPSSGVASTYPSTVTVSNLLGKITNVVISFSLLTHTNPNDLHMLLVSPSGKGMVFWSKVGGGGVFGGTPPDHHVTNITTTITDDAPDWSPLPEFYYIWTEKFRPGDYAAIEGPTNNFPSPAPPGPYAPVPSSNALHEAFQGLDGNGTWSLYIYDDAAPYGGRIDGGWSLTVSTTGPLPPTITDIADQTILTNTSTAALPFTMFDPDTAVGSLILSKASSNPVLIPTNNIVISGSGTNRTVTVTPVAGLSGSSLITLSVSDGTNVVSDSFTVNVITGQPQVAYFTNATGIGIRDTNSASPYPSTINVVGMNGIISNVTVTLRGFNHSWGADTDVLLVGPAGQKLMLMSDVGYGIVNNADFTFSDAAPSLMATNTLTTSTNRPTDLFDDSALGDIFPSPAPAGPYATNLSVFNGTNPNGAWSLYVRDDGPGDSGNITNGWTLNIATYPVANTPPTLSGISTQSTTVNTATAAIPFTVFDAETAPGSLVLTAFTSNAGLVPTNNIVFSGSGSNRTMTITPVSNQLGSVTISLSVTDGSLVASNSFVLTVNPATLVVTANSSNRVYGAINPVLTGSITGLQAGDNITAVFTNTAANTGSPVGLYTNTVTLLDPNGRLGNYVVTTNRGTLTVTAAPLSVTASNLSKVYGTTRVLVGTEFAITSGALVNGNTITSVTLASTGTNAGATVTTYPITATNAVGTGLANYTITYNTGTLTVTAAPLTVTANSTNKVYGTNRIFAGTEFAITSGALVNGNTLTSVTLASTGTNVTAAVGTYPITAASAVGSGLGNYSISYSSGTLSVTPATLTVTAGNTNKVYGTTLNPTGYTATGLLNGDSVTNVTLTSSGSVSNAVAGNYTITPSAAQGLGLANYTIGYNTGTLAVGNATLQITAGNTNKVYGTTLNPTVYAVTGLLNGDSVTNVTLTSSGAISNAAVGNYTITPSAAQGVGLANYTIGYNTGTLAVGNAALQITAGDTNKVYGTTLSPTAYSVAGLLNGDSVTNVTLASAGSVSNAGVGNHPINVSGAQGIGLANYTITYNAGTLSVGAASLQITAGNTNKVYGTTLTPTSFSVAGLLNSDTVTNVTLASAGSVSNAAVGGYTINASGAQGAGLANYTIGYNTGTLTVGAASLQVTANSTNKIYGTTLNPTEYSVSGLLNGDSVTNVTLTSAGSVNTAPVASYPINASAAQGVGLGNYTIGYNNGLLTVGAANLQITAGNTNKVYGATLNPAGYAVTGLLGGDSVTNVTLASAGSVSNAPVGSYSINASAALGVGLTNYTIGYTSGSMTVGAANLQIAANDTNKVYGATLNPAAYSVVGLLNDDSVTNVTLVSAGSISNAPVGVYAVDASAALGIGLTNYTIGYTSGSLTVAAANLVITAANTNKVYGTTVLPTVYSVEGLLHGHSVTNVTLTSAGSASNASVGNYVISASNALGIGLTNYTIGYNDGALTVGLANLLITASDTNKIYGATLNPTEFSVAGLVSGDSVTNVTLASAGSVSNAPVGNYAINVSGASGVGLSNYTIGYNSGTLTVGAANLLITAGNSNKVYGATLTPTAFSAAGLLNGDTVSSVTLVSSGSVSNASAGSYAINASAALGAGLTNYSISYSNGTLVVAKASLIVTADNKSRIYGQANPAFTLSYNGFVNGEGANVIDVLPSASTLATTNTAPGGYPITVTGGSDDNYTLSLVDGTLTISAPAPTTITQAQVLLDGQFRIAGSGDANVSYKVMASTNLQTWTHVGSTTTDELGAFEFVDATAVNFPARYYRLATE